MLCYVGMFGLAVAVAVAIEIAGVREEAESHVGWGELIAPHRTL